MREPADSPPTHEPTGSARWLSLGPASRLLEVDPDTLRRWADEGRVDAWTTPGGHRRFDRRELDRLARARRTGGTRGLASLGASVERFARVYRRHYAADGPDQHTDPSDDAARDAQRERGRRLVAALTAYLDGLDADEGTRARAEAEAGSIVDEQAGELARAGAGLTEAVSRFVVARQPFLAEIAAIGRRRSLDSARLATLYGEASTLLDRLLLRFIDTHRRAGG
ncbi:MAG TPA: helix-turn-helix domain-containing protein [Candidatus Limnocylindrales bacterium]|nr:helix-turn-helix domain-containing protein [Candidatus Limnocylindrales bacterium]